MTDIVRCCKATYSQNILNEHGIQVYDWTFPDGDPPPKYIIDGWLDLVDFRFKNNQNDDFYNALKQQPCIAAHCVAGLGRYICKRKILDSHYATAHAFQFYRAPVLVAIALIEEGMEPLDSIAFIRKHRKGAINNRQLKYLESYKRRKRSSLSCCIT